MCSYFMRIFSLAVAGLKKNGTKHLNVLQKNTKIRLERYFSRKYHLILWVRRRFWSRQSVTMRMMDNLDSPQDFGVWILWFTSKVNWTPTLRALTNIEFNFKDGCWLGGGWGDHLPVRPSCQTSFANGCLLWKYWVWNCYTTKHNLLLFEIKSTELWDTEL